jgi:hypothetical protein
MPVDQTRSADLFQHPDLRTTESQSHSGPGTFLATEFAGPRELRIALVAVIVSTLIFILAVPFAKMPLAQVPAFTPLYVATLVICYVITAVLLFG